MPQRHGQSSATVGGGEGVAPPGALNLRQGADAIGGLNLFDEGGDLNDDQAGADDQQDGNEDNAGKNQKRKPKKPDDDHTEDGDDTSGSQDDDQTADDADEESSDQSGDSVQDADGDDNQDTEITTLAQLAEAPAVDEKLIAEPQHTFKADGSDVTVQLGELTAGYQRDANYRRQTQELAETRRALEADYAQRGQHYEGQLAQLGQVLKQGEQLLVGEINTAEMQALRVSNPAEWAARREELQQRIQQVQGLYSYASQQYDQYTTQQATNAQAQLGELRRQEMENLQLAIPDWSDEARGKLSGYLDTSYGYSAEDLSNVFDSRLIVIANKARLYDEMQAVGKKTKKKVTKLPKVQKPGKGAQRPNKPGATNVRNARKKLANSGKVKDAATLIGLQFKDL